MRHSDLIMNEYCSRKLLNCFENKDELDSSILENFVISTAIILKSNGQLGPDAQQLANFLDTLYMRGIDKELVGFDKGAVFGALEVINYIPNERE